MIVYKRNRVKLFPAISHDKYDLIPTVLEVNKRTVSDENFTDQSKNKRTDIKLELYAVIDQRTLYTRDVGKISAFVSRFPLSDYKRRNNPFAKIDIKSPRAVNNIIFDIQNINEYALSGKTSDMIFLTSFDIMQNFDDVKVNKNRITKVSDTVAFGTKEVIEIKKVKSNGKTSLAEPGKRRNRTSPGRNQKEYQIKDIKAKENIDTLDIINDNKAHEKSGKSFKNLYNTLTKKGEDPVKVFEKKESSQSFREKIKGIVPVASLGNVKSPFTKIRKKIENDISEQIKNLEDASENVTIVKKKVPARNKKISTSFNIDELTLRSYGNEYYIILYAYDKKGKIIDASNYIVDNTQVLEQLTDTSLDFEITSSRTNTGKVVSQITNNDSEKDVNINLYGRQFKPGSDIKEKRFTTSTSDIEIPKNENTKMSQMSKGKKSSTGDAGSPSKFGNNYQVAIRATSNFRGKEIHNVKSSSVNVSGKKYLEGEKHSSGLITGKISKEGIALSITGLQEDVVAARPLRRKIGFGKNKKNTNYVPLLDKTDLNNIVTVGFARLHDNKSSVKKDYDNFAKMLAFSDNDVRDGETYEYVVETINKCGKRIINYGSVFIETYEKPSEKIEITTSNYRRKETGSSSSIIADVKLIHKKDEVDKVLEEISKSSEFDLFKDDLKEIKDIGNILMSAKVERINKTTGEVTLVGNYTPNASGSIGIRDAVSENRGDDLAYKVTPRVLSAVEAMAAIKEKLGKINQKNKFEKSSKTSFGSGKERSKQKSKKLISTVGTKYSKRANRLKGRIQSVDSSVENGGLDVFENNSTGDVFYLETPSAKKPSLNVKVKNAKIQRIYSKKDKKNAKKTNHKDIEKKQHLIEMSFDKNDELVDFYTVVKKENNEVKIDGAMISTDDNSTTYNYMAETRGALGKIDYYVVPVYKTGRMGSVQPLGSTIIDREKE